MTFSIRIDGKDPIENAGELLIEKSGRIVMVIRPGTTPSTATFEREVLLMEEARDEWVTARIPLTVMVKLALLIIWAAVRHPLTHPRLDLDPEAGTVRLIRREV